MLKKHIIEILGFIVCTIMFHYIAIYVNIIFTVTQCLNITICFDLYSSSSGYTYCKNFFFWLFTVLNMLA
jgi:hypothetical protein